MRRGTLLTQVLLVNLLLIAVAVLAALLASNPESVEEGAATGIVLGFAVSATVAVNVFLLTRRFEPLEDLVVTMEDADLSRPAAEQLPEQVSGPEEVRRLQQSFREMLERLELERRKAARASLDAQERERARVALDLHDEVNQSLTGLIMRIEAIRRGSADPQVESELAETGAVARKAMEELLGLARRLRPTTLDDLGLEAALEALVDEVGRDNGMYVNFETEGDPSRLDRDLQLISYRVAQEALTNCAQHADAEHVRVRLISGDDGGVELRISDDGSGFEADRDHEGLGIAGMRERAMLCDGDLLVESRPGAGTRVTLRA
jgi:two-component system sensor histidine kinase UhpB